MRNLIRGLVAALLLATLPVASNAEVVVGVSVYVAPPALPVYVQPPPPAVGYIWMPGYWAWVYGGYYWVPGTWVLAPAPGLLWTPGYWDWWSGGYGWHAGYWGPHVGFYGGINYGFGYTGVGYEGGYWRGNEFYYNSAVTNVHNTNISNVYNHTVVNNVTVNNVSYNGGAGGVAAKPNAAELAAAREPHQGFTSLQQQHEQLAKGNNALRASVNGGRPSIAATAKAGTFSGGSVVAARGAVPYHNPPQAQLSRPATGQPPHSTNQSPHGGSAGEGAVAAHGPAPYHNPQQAHTGQSATSQPPHWVSQPSHGGGAAAQPARAPSYPGGGAYSGTPHTAQGHPPAPTPPPHAKEHEEHGR